MNIKDKPKKIKVNKNKLIKKTSMIFQLVIKKLKLLKFKLFFIRKDIHSK